MTDVIKKASPESLVVVGGPHATFTAELTLKRVPSIDVVVRGEGEQTMRELAEAVKRSENFRQIKGLTFKDGDKFVTTPPRELILDIDSLPFPSYDLFPPLDMYAGQGIAGDRRSGIIMTSRGCKYRCEFCYAVNFWQRQFRCRSPKNVVDEVEYLVNEFDVEFIKFFDDLFTYDQNRARKICEEIRARKISTNFLILSRVDTVSKELLRNLKDAGCEQIQYGLETGSERILRKVGKGITIETVEKVLSWTKKAGISTLVFLMIGLPGETVEDIEMTFDFIMRNHQNMDDVEAAINTILPGSRYYEMAKNSGKITDEIWFDYRNSNKLLWKDAPPYLENFDLEELLQYKRLQYILTTSWRDWGRALKAILGYLWCYKRIPDRYLALAKYLRRYRF